MPTPPHSEGESTTPKALSEDAIPSAIEAVSGSYRGSNLLEKLYMEAQSNDPNLEQLEEDWKAFREAPKDSLNAYSKYRQTNLQYMSQVTGYIQRIQDTLLREQMELSLQIFREEYENRVAHHEAEWQQIDSLHTRLEDYHLMLMIMITADMMRNYQANELPDLGGLQSTKQEYLDWESRMGDWLKGE